MKILVKKIIYGCEERGDAQSPYLTRWTLFENSRCALYLHIFHRSDSIEMHDHPWDFWSLILWRGYVEETPAYEHRATIQPRFRLRVWPGTILRRPAEWVHRVELVNEKPAVTLVFRRNYRREWGFFTKKGWQRWREYFIERGC